MSLAIVNTKKQMQNTQSDIKQVKKIRLLVVQYPQMSGYLKKFKEIKYMTFLIKDGKNKSVWGQISNIMKKGFDEYCVNKK